MNKKDKPSFSARLDRAVSEAFPGVECKTEFNIFAMAYASRWVVAGTGQKLSPAKARRVKDFVMGFSAAEVSRDGG